MNVFSEIGAGGEIEIVGMIIRIEGHGSGGWSGDADEIEIEGIVPNQLVKIVLEERTGVSALDRQAVHAELEAGAHEIVVLIDGFRKLFAVAGGGAGAGTGIHDGPDGTCALFAFAKIAGVNAPVRRQFIAKRNGAALTQNLWREEA